MRAIETFPTFLPPTVPNVTLNPHLWERSPLVHPPTPHIHPFTFPPGNSRPSLSHKNWPSHSVFTEATGMVTRLGQKKDWGKKNQNINLRWRCRVPSNARDRDICLKPQWQILFTEPTGSHWPARCGGQLMITALQSKVSLAVVTLASSTSCQKQTSKQKEEKLSYGLSVM